MPAAAWAPWEPDYDGQPYAFIQVYADWRVNFIELIRGPQGGIRFNSVDVGGTWETTADSTRIRWCWHRTGEPTRVPVLEHYMLHPHYNAASRAFPHRRGFRVPRVYFNEDQTRGSMLVELQMRVPAPPPPPPPPPPLMLNPVVIQEVIEEEVTQSVNGFLEEID